MIRAYWRRFVRFLGSAGFATSLLAVVGVWSMLGSFVAQGATSESAVTAWASAHPLMEPVVRVLGLHQAYSSPFFLACILALGLSTALCAWQRTKAAAGRAKALRRAAATDAASLAASHDLELPYDLTLSASEVLTVAERTLAGLGIKAKRRDETLISVSATWSVWGSPVFHWALLALIAALFVGNLLRAEGLMGVTVGQTKPDAAESYGTIHTGPLHDWSRIHRSIRVDAFDPAYTSGGIDRGPTPTVTLLDATGAVVKTQLVYPNHTLQSGSLTIYPSDFGLSAIVSLVGKNGVAGGTGAMLTDFSATATEGTVPVDFLGVDGPDGKPLYRIYVTVPLDRTDGVFVRRVPAVPTAHVDVRTPDGAPVVARTVGIGESVRLPVGDLRLEGVGYYARLSIVDDWSIPLLYLGLVVAMVGLTISVVARQQIVAATVIDSPNGPILAVKLRLWRNPSSSRSEIESELTRALAGVDEGNTP